MITTQAWYYLSHLLLNWSLAYFLGNKLLRRSFVVLYFNHLTNFNPNNGSTFMVLMLPIKLPSLFCDTCTLTTIIQLCRGNYNLVLMQVANLHMNDTCVFTTAELMFVEVHVKSSFFSAGAGALPTLLSKHFLPLCSSSWNVIGWLTEQTWYCFLFSEFFALCYLLIEFKQA